MLGLLRPTRLFQKGLFLYTSELCPDPHSLDTLHPVPYRSVVP